jgi:hypothetical protein
MRDVRQFGSLNRQSRPAVLAALGILLLWAALPTLHLLTATDCHNLLQCPVCESLHHNWQLGPVSANDLAAPALVALYTVTAGDAGLFVDFSALVSDTRAPPAA